jgi:hypothetical protein
MTPHRHWIQNYKKYVIPIHLADHTIVYSAGVGTVVFHPIIKGKPVQAVEFTRVLHVPSLRSNLLSVLYLTCHCGFLVHISEHFMEFERSGRTLFVASIKKELNAGFLDGTIEHISEFGYFTSTLPLDWSLWHCRLAHQNIADVQKLAKEE